MEQEILEQAQTEMGQKLDADSPRFSMIRYFDLADRPCTFGRWVELYEARPPWAGKPEPMPLWIIGSERRAYVEISTVWLGVNQAYLPNARPLIYETMVFGGALDGQTVRTSTRTEAHVAHQLVCNEAFVWWRNPEYRILLAFVATLAVILGLVMTFRG